MPVDDNFGDDPTTQTEDMFSDHAGSNLTPGPESPAPAESLNAPAPREFTEEPAADVQPGGQQRGAVDSSGLSDTLRQEAMDRYGFTDDDLASYATDDALSRSLGAIDRLAMSRFHQQIQSPQKDAPPPPDKQEEQQQQAWTPKKLELGLGEDFEPDVVEVLNKINEHYHQQMLESHKQVQQLGDFAATVQAQQHAAYEKQLDEYFDSLPEQYQSVFGKGPMRGLQPNSAQWLARRQWEQDYQTQLYMDEMSGREMQPFDEYTSRVTRARWGNIADQATRDDIRQQAAAQRRKAMVRPSSRRTKAASPEERAADIANRFYEERGELHPSGLHTRGEF